MAFRFESLEIWKLSLIYASHLYDVAQKFPIEERFALEDQLRRAAVSISNNIAEGSGSATDKNFRSKIFVCCGTRTLGNII